MERLEGVTVDQVRKLYEEQLGGQSGEFVGGRRLRRRRRC